MDEVLINKDCLTCVSYRPFDTIVCSRSYDEKSIECPCALCLLKTMCQAQCFRYVLYWHEGGL